MKKIIYGLLAALFLIGCQQPTIDYNNFSDIDPSRPEVELVEETVQDEQQEEVVEEEIVIEEDLTETEDLVELEEETPVKETENQNDTQENTNTETEFEEEQEEIIEKENKEQEIDYSDRTIPGVEDDSDYEISDEFGNSYNRAYEKPLF